MGGVMVRRVKLHVPQKYHLDNSHIQHYQKRDITAIMLRVDLTY
jgi:hypothetical protein